ncbi:hypothetical protein [Amycolatopsis alba]|uniref:Uncharacterized protein n=1 Tax=Amycolatopsis alba DSM 44262 TaxID=1125972 RepID=A0A229RBR7_AMYAL|nr:hypothetical protein [Amycolatopsis alba]OXM43874.1 hypothetical protein CFP75_36790 [Amycolatopsis alba DSM 44262]
MTIATTPSGQPIVCDGCGAPVEVVTAAMRHPVPREIVIRCLVLPAVMRLLGEPLVARLTAESRGQRGDR